jgi:hypothetical protein
MSSGYPNSSSDPDSPTDVSSPLTAAARIHRRREPGQERKVARDNTGRVEDDQVRAERRLSSPPAPRSPARNGTDGSTPYPSGEDSLFSLSEPAGVSLLTAGSVDDVDEVGAFDGEFVLRLGRQGPRIAKDAFNVVDIESHQLGEVLCGEAALDRQ